MAEVTQIFEQYWTMDEVAMRLRASLPTVKRWIGKGMLEKKKAGGKTLVSETALQDFLRRSTDAAA